MAEYLHSLAEGFRYDEYEFVRVLGVGGFGITYLGYDHNLDKPVAIKEYVPSALAVRSEGQTIQPKSSGNQDDFDWGLERFLDEARVLGKFQNRNIIQVHRFFRHNNTAYIVMEYAEGETLSSVLESQGTLSETDVRDFLMPIINGLKIVHDAGILHRDIKPENIIIRDDNSPVLLDFGAARQLLGSRTADVTAFATRGYAPIEQYSSGEGQGPWTDVYGLGATAFRCVVGSRLQDATDRIINDKVGRWTEQLSGYDPQFLAAIDRAVALMHPDRPQSLGEWQQMLDGEISAAKKDASGRPRAPAGEEAVPVELGDASPGAEADTNVDGGGQTPPSAGPGKPKAAGGSSKATLIVATVAGLAVLGSALAYLLVQNGGDGEDVSATTQQEPGGQRTAEADGREATAPESPPARREPPATEVSPADQESPAGQDQESPAGQGSSESDDQRQAQAQRDEDAWQAALEEDTPDAFDRYAENFPDGRHVRDVPRAKDDSAFQLAQRTGSEAAYTDYIRDYPRGMYVSEARQLADDAAYRGARATATLAALEVYLGRYPNGQHAQQAQAAKETMAGHTFQDCDRCPKMTVIPAAEFRMGEPGASPSSTAQPVRQVTIPGPLAVGTYEVTWDEWEYCVASGGCKAGPTDKGFGRGTRPVTRIKWRETKDFVRWLSLKTGENYRLLSEAEWEYAARATTKGAYWWGDSVGSNRANCKDCGSAWGGKATAPVGSYAPNLFGLYDTAGNASEYVEDCWADSYRGMPNDASPRIGNCDQRRHVMRGGSWKVGSAKLRSFHRDYRGSNLRYARVGFRVAREISTD